MIEISETTSALQPINSNIFPFFAFDAETAFLDDSWEHVAIEKIALSEPSEYEVAKRLNLKHFVTLEDLGGFGVAENKNDFGFKCTYFFIRRQSDQVKIGRSANPLGRMDKFDTETNPTIFGGMILADIETQLHQHFANHRLPDFGETDEWFKLSEVESGLKIVAIAASLQNKFSSLKDSVKTYNIAREIRATKAAAKAKERAERKERNREYRELREAQAKASAEYKDRLLEIQRKMKDDADRQRKEALEYFRSLRKQREKNNQSQI